MLLHVSRQVLRVLNTSKVLSVKERQRAVTATNVAKVLGLDPYVSAPELLAAKVRVLEESPPMSIAAKIGVALEREVLELHANEYKLFLTYMPPGSFAQHPVHRGLAAALDGLSWCGKIIEIKTSGLLPDRPEIVHVCQILFLLAVTGLKRAHLVYALRKDVTQRVVFAFDAKPELQAKIVERMLTFRDVIDVINEDD